MRPKGGTKYFEAIGRQERSMRCLFRVRQPENWPDWAYWSYMHGFEAQGRIAIRKLVDDLVKAICD